MYSLGWMTRGDICFRQCKSIFWQKYGVTKPVNNASFSPHFLKLLLASLWLDLFRPLCTFSLAHQSLPRFYVCLLFNCHSETSTSFLNPVQAQPRMAISSWKNGLHCLRSAVEHLAQQGKMASWIRKPSDSQEIRFCTLFSHNFPELFWSNCLTLCFSSLPLWQYSSTSLGKCLYIIVMLTNKAPKCLDIANDNFCICPDINLSATKIPGHSQMPSLS